MKRLIATVCGVGLAPVGCLSPTGLTPPLSRNVMLKINSHPPESTEYVRSSGDERRALPANTTEHDAHGPPAFASKSLFTCGRTASLRSEVRGIGQAFPVAAPARTERTPAPGETAAAPLPGLWAIRAGLSPALRPLPSRLPRAMPLPATGSPRAAPDPKSRKREPSWPSHRRTPTGTVPVPLVSRLLVTAASARFGRGPSGSAAPPLRCRALTSYTYSGSLPSASWRLSLSRPRHPWRLALPQASRLAPWSRLGPLWTIPAPTRSS